MPVNISVALLVLQVQLQMLTFCLHSLELAFFVYKLKAETKRHFNSIQAARNLARFFEKPVFSSNNRKTALAAVSVEASLQFHTFSCLNAFKDQSKINRFSTLGHSGTTKAGFKTILKIFIAYFEKLQDFGGVHNYLMDFLFVLQHHLALGDMKENSRCH